MLFAHSHAVITQKHKDVELTLYVSMNFSSSSGGIKSPMWCLPRPKWVSLSAQSANRRHLSSVGQSQPTAPCRLKPKCGSISQHQLQLG